MFHAVMFIEPSLLRGISPAGAWSTVEFWPSRSDSDSVVSRAAYGRLRTSSTVRWRRESRDDDSDCAEAERAKRAVAARRSEKAGAILS